MSGNLQQLITKYHAFYEVSPYNIVVEEGHGSPGATRRIIQAGFDVDVHGISEKVSRMPSLDSRDISDTHHGAQGAKK